MIRGKVNTPSIRREHHEEREAPPLHRIKRQVKAAQTNSRGGFRFG